ncbi:uncharacterized protein LOC133956940 [Platichthys flesus]|uniref:uncharacterized protein LOC133956940 n=1 Tax=Platichthys flesus TaxID=8260 RepID=UPI002DBA5333|nr:uncharacterized protein LOC133956940 [Platichthys flesus]
MLHFQLSTTLFLATICLFQTTVSMETVITCDNGSNVQRLSCDTGVVRVDAALYGRSNRETCSEGRPPQQLANTSCSQKGTVNVLKNRCDGKKVCEINTNIVRTSDPCFGIYKYLETSYTCVPAIPVVACEGSSASLSCDEGQVILVIGADYGRHDQTTCSYKRPESQLRNVDCSGPTSKVADSCNGKNSCTVDASNGVLGDTCVGTYKYLGVAYVCAYPDVTPHEEGIRQRPQGRIRRNSIQGYKMDASPCGHCPIINNVEFDPQSELSNLLFTFQQIKHELSALSKKDHSRYDCCVVIMLSHGTETNSQTGCPVTIIAWTGSSKTMLHFQLSTTLLLATICLFQTTVSKETVITCDNGSNVQRLSCDTGVVRVDAALYGRSNRETCSEGRPPQQLANTSCSQKGTVNVLKTRCDGKKVCEINTNIVRTSNPCPGIHKYLETNYTCVPAIRVVACEGSSAHLFCDVGQVIFVIGADYGRHDQTTCSYKRTEAQLRDVDCSGPTSKVADSCNGKNSCTVHASNRVLGDTCVKIYKYLGVAYLCEYPLLTPDM